jgi:hypothetical protein
VVEHHEHAARGHKEAAKQHASGSHERGVTGWQGAVLPICGEQGFQADLNETRSIRPGMSILLNQIRLLAVIAVFSVVWFNAAVGMPIEALGDVKKTVLVLHGDRSSIPAVKTTEQGLMAACRVGSRKTWKFSRNTSTSRVSRRPSMGTISCVICAQGTRRESQTW